jgi:hypothetical protein
MPQRPERKSRGQISTRVPKALHHRMRVHCVTIESLVRDFIVEAIEEKLARDTRRPQRAG